MNPAVPVEAWQRIAAMCSPVASLAEAAGEIAEPFGFDASLTEGMDWQFWAHLLDHRHDDGVSPPMQSWKRRCATHLAGYPPPNLRTVLGWREFWESEYRRLIGCYQRAAELEHLTPVSPGQHDLLVDYRRALDGLWSELWWLVGWLPRYVHHQRRAGVPW